MSKSYSDRHKTETDGYIISTAIAYDMTPFEVLSIYNKCSESEFYNELESFIKQRQ